MSEYKASISHVWGTELGVKERIAYKQLDDTVKINEMLESGESVNVVPSGIYKVDVHNPKASNPDYNVMLIVDKDGVRYTTSSESAFSSVSDILDELANTDFDGEFSLEFKTFPSKNFSGKSFIKAFIH